ESWSPAASASASASASVVPTGTPRSRSSKRKGTIIGASAPPAATAGDLIGVGHEVLLLLEQRAQEGEVLIERHVLDAGALEHGDPVDELARARALAEPRHVAELVEDLDRLI